MNRSFLVIIALCKKNRERSERAEAKKLSVKNSLSFENKMAKLVQMRDRGQIAGDEFVLLKKVLLKMNLIRQISKLRAYFFC